MNLLLPERFLAEVVCNVPIVHTRSARPTGSQLFLLVTAAFGILEHYKFPRAQDEESTDCFNLPRFSGKADPGVHVRTGT